MTWPLTIDGTLKWLTLLPILMQDYSGGDSVALGMDPLPPPPPLTSPTEGRKEGTN